MYSLYTTKCGKVLKPIDLDNKGWMKLLFYYKATDLHALSIGWYLQHASANRHAWMHPTSVDIFETKTKRAYLKSLYKRRGMYLSLLTFYRLPIMLRLHSLSISTAPTFLIPRVFLRHISVSTLSQNTPEFTTYSIIPSSRLVELIECSFKFHVGAQICGLFWKSTWRYLSC